MSSKKECNDCEIHLRGMKIGTELKKRIKRGGVDEDRVNEFEKKELRKLECVDEAHTKLYNLTTKEADRYISKFNEFLLGKPPLTCPELKEKVASCLASNQSDALKCSGAVEAFASCVDGMMLEAARRDDACAEKSGPGRRKLSYAQKFHNICAGN